MPIRTRLSLVAMLITGFFCSGCNVIGVVAAKTMPPPKVPAAYDLRELTASVHVSADPQEYGDQRLVDTDFVALRIERHLEKVKNIDVEPSEADRRIVVDLEPFSTDAISGSNLSDGKASARVRVFSGPEEEVYPLDGTEGRQVSVDLARVPGGPVATRRATLILLADSISRLFYPHVAGE